MGTAGVCPPVAPPTEQTPPSCSVSLQESQAPGTQPLAQRQWAIVPRRVPNAFPVGELTVWGIQQENPEWTEATENRRTQQTKEDQKHWTGRNAPAVPSSWFSSKAASVTLVWSTAHAATTAVSGAPACCTLCWMWGCGPEGSSVTFPNISSSCVPHPQGHWRPLLTGFSVLGTLNPEMPRLPTVNLSCMWPISKTEWEVVKKYYALWWTLWRPWNVTLVSKFWLWRVLKISAWASARCRASSKTTLFFLHAAMESSMEVSSIW